MEKQTVGWTESEKEEIFMYLSIFVSLIAYRFNLTWLMWIFIPKAIMELISSIILIRKNK